MAVCQKSGLNQCWFKNLEMAAVVFPSLPVVDRNCMATHWFSFQWFSDTAGTSAAGRNKPELSFETGDVIFALIVSIMKSHGLRIWLQSSAKYIWFFLCSLIVIIFFYYS